MGDVRCIRGELRRNILVAKGVHDRDIRIPQRVKGDDSEVQKLFTDLVHEQCHDLLHGFVVFHPRFHV